MVFHLLLLTALLTRHNSATPFASVTRCLFPAARDCVALQVVGHGIKVAGAAVVDGNKIIFMFIFIKGDLINYDIVLIPSLIDTCSC